MSPEDASILKQLSAPFRSDEVQFKIQTNPKDTDKEPFALVVAYVDARAVSARLNEVAGLQWSSEFMPSATGNGVECRLTVLGSRRADVGTESKQDADKGGYSDALKRAAVHFGIGAYLYDFPAVRAKVEQFGKGWYLTKEAKQELAQLVQAIHNGARTLPRFNHIRVREYRPIFDAQTNPAPAATNGHTPAQGSGDQPMLPAQKQRLREFAAEFYPNETEAQHEERLNALFMRETGHGMDEATAAEARGVIALVLRSSRKPEPQAEM